MHAVGISVGVIIFIVAVVAVVVIAIFAYKYNKKKTDPSTRYSPQKEGLTPTGGGLNHFQVTTANVIPEGIDPAGLGEETDSLESLPYELKHNPNDVAVV